MQIINKSKHKLRLLANQKVEKIGQKIKNLFKDNLAAYGTKLVNDIINKNYKLKKNVIVAVFSSFKNEVDSSELINLLNKNTNIITVLPTVSFKSRYLIFKEWKIGDKLQKNSKNIFEPLDIAKKYLPDILFIPVVAFDKQGYRLGYGGGYYDYTLIQLCKQKDCFTIGVGFSCQKFVDIPHSGHDQKLDFFITEKEIINIKS